MKVRVDLEGCDDVTSVLVEVTKNQLKALEKLSDETHEAGGGCAPVMVLHCSKRIEMQFGRSVPCGRLPGHEGECDYESNRRRR